MLDQEQAGTAPDATTFGASVYAVALQPALTLTDYLDAEQFFSHLDRLIARALADRKANEPAVVLLPEDIGTFLALSSVPSAATARTLANAWTQVARARFRSLVGAWLKAPRSPRSLLLGDLGDAAFEPYDPGMRNLARRHRVYLAAGSLLLRQPTPPSPDIFQPEGRDVYNVAPVYDPAGSVVAVTHKTNLVPGLETSLGLRAAPPRIVPFRAGGLRFAVMICFDACVRSHVPDKGPFTPLWPLADTSAVDVFLQPSANPAPWHAPWPYSRDGVPRTEESAWQEAAVEAALARSGVARYALTSFLNLRLFDLTFEGESRIFAKNSSGDVRRVSRAGGYAAEHGDRFAAARMQAQAAP